MLAYLDLPAGLSGDMFLGCLVDGGWSVEQLRSAVGRLGLPADQWAVSARQVYKGPFRATQVEVRADEGPHERHLADVRQLIESADLPPAVKQQAVAVFTRLAHAEAKVHGWSADKVHFHEVGAIDAIIDIVGVVAGLHALGVDRLYASPVPLGPGWATTAHGPIPLPAPATLELLAAVRAPTRPAPGPGEHLTPTGAALLAELAAFEQPAMDLCRIGVGAGQRNPPWPNVARLWLGEPSAAVAASVPASPTQADGGPAPSLVQLETNIDDMNPQLYPAVSEQLFAAGAKDVWLVPVQMKKGRPGVVLSVVGTSADEAALAAVLFRHTTTLGVRVHGLRHRHEARREVRHVRTPFGEVGVKIKWVVDGGQGEGAEAVGATPEYEDCRSAAEAAGVPVRVAYDAAVAAAQVLLVKLQEGRAPLDRGDDTVDPNWG